MLKDYEYESDKEEPLYLTKDTPKLNSLIDSKLFEGIPLYWRDLHLTTIDVSEKKCFQDLLGSYGTAIVNLNNWDFSKAVTLNRLGLRSAGYKDSRVQYSQVEQGECKFKFKFKNIDFDANPWGQSVDCVCDNG